MDVVVVWVLTVVLQVVPHYLEETDDSSGCVVSTAPAPLAGQVWSGLRVPQAPVAL